MTNHTKMADGTFQDVEAVVRNCLNTQRSPYGNNYIKVPQEELIELLELVDYLREEFVDHLKECDHEDKNP